LTGGCSTSADAQQQAGLSLEVLRNVSAAHGSI
jgi:hypothetical protein